MPELSLEFTDAYRQTLLDLQAERQALVTREHAPRIAYAGVILDLHLSQALLGYVLQGLREAWSAQEGGVREAEFLTLGREVRQWLTTLEALQNLAAGPEGFR